MVYYVSSVKGIHIKLCVLTTYSN